MFPATRLRETGGLFCLKRPFIFKNDDGMALGSVMIEKKGNGFDPGNLPCERVFRKRPKEDASFFVSNGEDKMDFGVLALIVLIPVLIFAGIFAVLFIKR